MTEAFIRTNSLVLYRGRPARVLQVGEKLTLDLDGSETVKVRLKDVTPLHAGPLTSLTDLRPLQGDVIIAWELLAGQPTTLNEIAELTYGSYTPATAWAAWQLAVDGLYYRVTPEQSIRACSAAEVTATQLARAADALEREAWEAFLGRARNGKVAVEDRRFLREVEDLAFQRSTRSRVLKALGREESPENAHACLLEWGAWDETMNPHPMRLRLDLTPPSPTRDLPNLNLRGDTERRDLTHLLAYAIDDAETDTPDDALSWEPGPGLGRLWVHIADAAALIPPDSALDVAARGRGVALYLPEGNVPMLPTEAIARLGLGLNEISPALSFGLDVAEDGRVVALTLAPSFIRATRLTYEAANERMQESPLAEMLRIGVACRQRRQAQDAVEIELPEVDVRLRAGEVRIEPVHNLASRLAVENAMILVGEAVAAYGLAHGIPLCYATQEASDALPPSTTDPTTLSAMYALRRTMRPSQYRSAAAPHSGLGLAAYAQATSPLRRYLDLVAHQQLRAHLRGKPLLTTDDLVARIGEVEPALQAARQAERFSVKHWTLVYLLRHPGWRGRAVLVEKHNMSGTFSVPELALETQLHLNADLPLDAEATLALRSVDLPRQDARFRIMQAGG